MAHYIGVKFRDQGHIYYFQSTPFVVQKGTKVIVKTNEGLGLGTVALLLDEPPRNVDPDVMKPIFRVASQEDEAVQHENEVLAKEAFETCKRYISQHGLDMKLVDVEVFFDRSKIVFYFTAPGRIDFRELVKDLVKIYRTRIELRQIGVRHEAQMLGGIGNCGQVCCCRRFLRQFEPVTIKMAKEQQLFLNPAKISGACGRLLCCLGYEQENYAQFRKRCPKIGKKLQTSLGRVKVLRSNLLRDSLVVLTEQGEEKEITLEEWDHIYPAPAEVGQDRDRPREPRKPTREDRQGKPAREDKPKKSARETKPEPRQQKTEAAPSTSQEDKGKASQAAGDASGDAKTPKPKKRRGRSRGRRKKTQKAAPKKKS